MTHTIIRRAAATLGVAALVAASVLVGATSAQAGSPDNDCETDPTVGTLVDIQTPGAWWYDVCLNTTVVEEGETTNKTDGFDGLGNIAVVGVSDPVAAIPTSAGYVGSDYVVEFTDAGFDLGGGDLVDIVVTQTFSGTFVRWEVNFFDAGTTTPRSGVLYTISGDLGCDSDCFFQTGGNEMLTAGDSNDPIILWEVDADNLFYNVVDGDGGVVIDLEGDAVLTVGLVDYACDDSGDVESYIFGILDDGVSNHFGESLRVPGTTDCVIVGGPLELTTGQSFSYEVPLTLLTPPWDFSGGGSTGVDYGQLPFVDYEELNGGDAGVQPGMRIFGTAPTAPGTYYEPIYVGDDEGTYSRGFLTIIVSEPKLAATGVDLTVPLAAGLGLTVLGALALAGSRRRRATEI